MKKVIASILSLALATSVGVALVACNDNENTPQPSKPTISETELLKGVWETPQYGDATHALKDYVAFHDDGVFYWRAQGDKTPSAGNYTFTLENGDVKVTIDDSQKGEYDIDVEAWVTLKTFKGEVIAPTPSSEGVQAFGDGKYPIAYDATEKQYVLYGIHYGDMRFIHDPDRAHTYADENAITVASYTGESALRKVELGHNGKYTDMATGTPYEGKWAYNAATKTYTLTDDEGGGTATIVESNDGATGAYKRGETELTLDNDDYVARLAYKFTGAMVRPDSTTNLTIELYENNKFDVIMTDYGSSMVKGTWTKDGDNFTLSSDGFTQLGLPMSDVPMNTADGGETYTFMGGSFTPVSLIELRLQGVIAANGTNLSIVLSTDNTFKATMSDYGMDMAEGTWTKSGDNYVITADALASLGNKEQTLTKVATGYTFAGSNFIAVAEDVTGLFTGKRETPSQEPDGEPTVTYLAIMLHKNGNFEVVMTAYGNNMVAGTWAKDGNNYNLTSEGFTALGSPVTTVPMTKGEGGYTFMNMEFKSVAL